MPARKGQAYRRETIYPAKLNFSLPADLREAIDAEADATGRSASAVARDALARGLPLVRDAARKRRRQPGRNGG